MTRQLEGGSVSGARTDCADRAAFFLVVESTGDPERLDLLNQRIRMYENMAWMLRSLLDG